MKHRIYSFFKILVWFSITPILINYAFIERVAFCSVKMSAFFNPWYQVRVLYHVATGSGLFWISLLPLIFSLVGFKLSRSNVSPPSR